MENPLISIIVPCYNQAQYLDECLQSVLDQTYPNWECIIVNDGSPDNTEEVAKKWPAKDSRFRYFYKENKGVNSARNFGLKQSKGEMIQLLDCDDIISKDKFHEQLKDLVDHDVSVCDYFPFNDLTREYLKGRYISPFFNESFFKKEVILDWEFKKIIPCHCVLFKKKIADQLSFDENLVNHEDWVFWVQLFYNVNQYKNNPNVFAFYRIREASNCNNAKLMQSGFLKASKTLMKYFKFKNDKEYYNYSKLKNIELRNKYLIPFDVKVKRFLLLFIPSFIIRQKDKFLKK